MLYAAYGSNLHPLRLVERCPSAEAVGVSTLSGWQLRFNKHGRDESGKANIITGNGEVYLSVYELSDEDRPVLDTIEGPGYEARSIELEGFGTCFTYVATALGTLDPFDWYKDLVLAGARFHRFPDRYLAELDAFPATTDPDPGRSQRNRALLQRMESYR